MLFYGACNNSQPKSTHEAPDRHRHDGDCVFGRHDCCPYGEFIDGDNIISVFPRRSAQIIDDIIAYLKAAGYQ